MQFMQKMPICDRDAVSVGLAASPRGLHRKKQPQLLLTKILLAMKLTGFFMVLGLLGASAKSVSQTVSFTGKNVAIAKVFEAVEQQTGYTVFANKGLLKDVRPVTVSSRQMPLNEFLDMVLKNQPIEYQISNKTIFIKERPRISRQLQGDETADALFLDVTGIVRNAAGVPLEGATVTIKGSSTVTTTNAEGRFSIKAEKGQTLVISYVGHQSEQQMIGDDTSITVVLKEVESQLEQVVVTALGIPKKVKALTYNVQEISGKEVTTVKDASFINSLAGKVAGVTINSSSAGMGGSTRVVLRGTKSLSSVTSANNALYVVDGIPLPSLTTSQPNDVFSGAGQTGDGISNINPEDIESISVLSGPSAAALYGSQAANGVVMITTKKGSKDGFSLSATNSTTFHSPFVMPDFQNRYGSEKGSYYSWGEKLATPSSYDPKDFFQTGTNVTNTVSLSTGNEKNQTYLSLAAVNASGIIHNNDLDRYNFSVRNTSKFLDDKFTMDLSMMYVKLEEQNMLSQGQYFNPLIPVYLFPRGDDISKYQAFERYDPIRNFKTQYWPFGDLGFQMQNPYWITERNMFTNNKDRFLVSAALKYDVNSWINITGRARFDRNSAVNERKYYASTSGLFADAAGAYYKYNMNTQQIYADVLVNINRNFNNFSLNANVGTSIQDVKYDNASIGGDLQSVPNLFTASNLNLSQIEIFQDGYHEQTQGLFASAQIGYKSLVFLDVTGRSDWASPLANTKSSSFFYPSVGLSGVLSDIFDIRSDVLSFLKARVSYSEVGNAIPRYVSIATFPVINGYPQTSTYLPATDMEPERTKSYEAGFNVGLFRNKLKIDATVYQSSTYNQLFNPSLSPSSGYSSFYVNAGRIDNKGIELSLSLNQKLGEVDWTSNIVYSLNRNKIKALLPSYYNKETGETVAVDSLDMGGTASYKMILVEGGSMGDVYVNTLKMDEHGYIWVNSTNFTVAPDQNRYIKAGNANPDFNLGFRNSFAWKNFNLGFLITGRFGGVGVSVTQAVMDAFGVSEATAKAREEGAVVNGYRLPAQQYYQTIGGGTSGIGAMYVYSATNIRLGEAYIGYDVPVKKFSNCIKGLNVSVIGRNLFMFYNKAPFDPESTANTGTYYQGVDYFMQPSLRSIGFAAKLRF
ncbi:SusC/RagA family TonB-linked outer membrane protein [Chitinophaga sp. SYP-B3965]|nr:SusC/RagA family TonB-linked outer membrane protein [Chitinophaga sp. SYP-B3965]